MVAFRRLLLLALVPAACSLTPLDDLSANAGQDSGTPEGGSSGDCQAGVNCNGCASCEAWCGCVASNALSQCLPTCSATGGSSGVGGAGGAPDASSGGSGGGVTTGGSGGASDAGLGGSSGTSGGGSGGVSGSGGVGGSGGGAAATGGTVGGTGGGDAGVPTPGTVACGAEVCSLATSVCCVQFLGNEGQCVAIGGACSGVTAECDGPEDCGGELSCCFSFQGTKCQSGACSTLVCGASPEICPPGKLCKPYNLVKTINTCQ